MIITQDEQISIQRHNLHTVLQLIVFNKVCWHVRLEDLGCNQLADKTDTLGPCSNACPVCNNELAEMFPPLNCDYVTEFLSNTFINTSSDKI